MNSTKTHRPRKRFGQNFLHDKNVIHHIVAHINPAAGDQLVEIGPGLGALTEALVERVKPVHAIEVDNDLVEHLRARFSPDQLILHHNDALTFDLCSLAQKDKKIRLLGNLPYNISTPLIFHALENIDCIQDMTFMLQKEVVQRICAAPGSKHYGRLSVMVQYWCRTQKLFDVGSGAFKPAPKVDSAIVYLQPYDELPVTVNNAENFKQVVQAAFGQRRKTLRNSLKQLLNEEEIKILGINPGQRAEALDIYAFAALSNAVTDKNF